MPEFTFDQFQRIHYDLTYEQVVELLGAPGEKVPFRDANEFILKSWESMGRVRYQWMNGNGSRLIVLFLANGVAGKAEYGLNPGKTVYVIDGARFSTLEEFASYFSQVVLKDHQWKGGLDAFNDILRGGFGTPEDGFVLRWINSALSRERLGYPKIVRWFRGLIRRCHPASIPDVKRALAGAKGERGGKLFDLIVEIIREHGPEGNESADGVELQLL